MPKEKAEAIQVKTIITLKYWVETQIDDFDEDLIMKLHELIDLMAKEDTSQRPKGLRHVIDKRVAERNEKTRLMLSAPTNIEIPPKGLAPIDLLLNYDAQTIAEQLTLIDHHIYKTIKVVSFLSL